MMARPDTILEALEASKRRMDQLEFASPDIHRENRIQDKLKDALRKSRAAQLRSQGPS